MTTPRAFRTITCFAGFAAASALLIAQEDTPDKRLRDSTAAFHEIMAAPDHAIPRSLLEKAQCIVIIPGVKKAAFLVGAEYGRGFASCRTPGSWSAPAPVRIAGGSFGIQMGADSADIVLMLMNQNGLERLLADKFSIGADLSAAAGPVGRDVKADTDILLRAEILSWSRTRGVFAGASLNGTIVESDKAEAIRLYGRPWSNRDIIQGAIAIPEAARVLSDELARDVYKK
jgi:lipid-binding SYLF domain-containing protein